MRKLAMILALVSFEALAGEVSRETSDGEHPHTTAINYCSSRGGLAQYTVQGDVVKFSCADDLSSVITISTD